jgi:hypothetical protein
VLPRRSHTSLPKPSAQQSIVEQGDLTNKVFEERGRGRRRSDLQHSTERSLRVEESCSALAPSNPLFLKQTKIIFYSICFSEYYFPERIEQSAIKLRVYS